MLSYIEIEGIDSQVQLKCFAASLRKAVLSISGGEDQSSLSWNKSAHMPSGVFRSLWVVILF